MTEYKSPKRFIRMEELVNKIGFARSTIFSLIKEGQIPPPFKLTPNGRAIGWFEETIDEWMDARASDQNNLKMQRNYDDE